MKISADIINDCISEYDCGPELAPHRSFSGVALLQDGNAPLNPDLLYIGSGRDELSAEGNVIRSESSAIEIYNRLQELFITLNKWYQDMQETVITKKSLQDILTLSEPILGNFISVSDSVLSLIAYTQNITTDDPISLFLIANGYHSEESFQKFKQNNRFETWTNSEGLVINSDCSIAKYPVVSKVFSFGKTYFTHVVMSCNNRPLTPGLIELFGIMARVMDYCVKNEWEDEKQFSHDYNSLFQDIMNRSVTENALSERSRIAGIRANEQYAVLLPTAGMDSSFPGRTAAEITSRFRYVRAVNLNSRQILFVHGDNLAKLLNEGDLLRQMEEYFTQNSIVCGMSDIFSSLLDLPDACHQAELAIDERQVELGISKFSDCFERCVFDRSEQAVQTFKTSMYGKMLLSILHNDIAKNTNNFEVLQAYMQNDRRALETGRQLHMHRNNVVYRVKRIEELFGVDIEDTKVRRSICVAFFAYDALKSRLKLGGEQ